MRLVPCISRGRLSTFQTNVFSMGCSFKTPCQKNKVGGLCEDIAVRRRKKCIKEEVGSLRAQDDWSRLVGPTKHFRGSLAHSYSFMQLTVSECLPARLETISYANELAFLHDGESQLSNIRNKLLNF